MYHKIIANSIWIPALPPGEIAFSSPPPPIPFLLIHKRKGEIDFSEETTERKTGPVTFKLNFDF